MPRVPRFRVGVIADLERQLRFAPAEARRREMAAAETLLAEVDPEATYPADFVVYRITGYRSDRDETPVAIVGAALVSDLAVLIQYLSRNLDLPADFEGRRAIPLDEVAVQLEVSPKTIQRYRRKGLVCHHVRFASGVVRLACFEDALARFRAGHAKRLNRAARFSRLDDDMVATLVADAHRLHDAEGLSLNEAAFRLARKCGRAHETVRMILRRAEEASPVFGEAGPLDARARRLIDRAAARSVSYDRLAARLGRTPSTIRRTHLRTAADALARLELAWVELPTFAHDDADTVILAHPAVTSNLTALPPSDDLVRLVEAAHTREKPSDDTAAALVAGYNLLKRRVVRRLADRPGWPGTQFLDEIATDLRWATALKRRLVGLALPVGILRLEQHLARPLAGEPADMVEGAVRSVVSVASMVVETIDPSRDQRLDRVAGYAVDRALASGTVPRPEDRGRATARHTAGAVSAPRLYCDLTVWEPRVALAAHLVERLGLLDPERARIIRLAYGLADTAPQTMRALAEREGMSRTAFTRLVNAILATLRKGATTAQADREDLREG